MGNSNFGPVRCTLALAIAAVTFGAPMAVQAQSASKQERVVVTFKAGQAAAAREAIARAGGKVVIDLSDDDAYAVRLPRGAVSALKRAPGVDGVHADPIRRLMGSKSPNARGVSPMATATSERIPFGIPMVQADAVSFNPEGGRKLCIIDSGYNLGHEDLQATGLTGVDLTVSPAPGTSWNTDENSHGTHVAGTIAALGGNGKGVVGVVPGGNLPLHIAKVFDASGSAQSSAIIKGVQDCRRAGANIISMSLGGGAPNNFEAKVYERMAKRGVLVIAAAGNAGDTSTSYPAGYPSVMSVAAIDVNKMKAGFSQSNADVEIAAPGVDTLSTVPAFSQGGASVSVGGTPYEALGMDGSPETTATGPLVDIGFGDVAPAPGSLAGKVCLISRGNISFSDKVLNCQAGGAIGAIVYNNTTGALAGTLGGVATTIPSAGVTQAAGAAMLGQLGQSATVSVFRLPDLYASYNGTSMATPHASGVAALVWSNFPSCSVAQIRNALTASAMDLGTAGRDNDYGYGLIQAKAAVDYLTVNGCAAP